MKKKVNSILFLILLSGLSVLSPQEKSTELYLGLNFINNINTNKFDKYWSTSPAFGLNLCAKEDIGEFGFGFNLAKFNKKVSSAENFYGIDYYFMYKNQVKIFDDFYLEAKINLGLFEFRFTDLDLSLTNDAGEVEREFFIKYLLGFSYSIYKNWQAEILTSFQKIYTRKTIDFINLEMGLKYKFNSPDWLEEFFN